MVVAKPVKGLVQGKNGLLQSAIKGRGPENPEMRKWCQGQLT